MKGGLFDVAAQLRAIANVDLREALVSITDREMLLTVFADEFTTSDVLTVTQLR
jgi:hypothetical protein